MKDQDVVREIEMNTVSRKYESFRLKNKYREQQLLGSIAESGIREPLSCIRKSEENYILLDGYKRLRCLIRLKQNLVPVTSISGDEQEAILYLIRLSNNKSLQTLEQSCFLDELQRQFGLSVTDMANRLSVSPAWVSVRLGIIEEMSEIVKQKIFSGEFPVRSYMYTLKPFTRVNNQHTIDSFVTRVAGKKLSTRDIDTLAYGYFRGGTKVREQIEQGNINWTLKTLKGKTGTLTQDTTLSSTERAVISDLELLQKYLQKAIRHLSSPISAAAEYEKNVRLLLAGIHDLLKSLEKQIGAFDD
ncbi:MAG: ParB-like nuclease domain-containing protein [Candidatus Heimdallarchaeota archaeon]|nr:ParB-like nuclease domain-containing protein [Candidatus Heimdallarchaeota archaeon]